MKNRISFFLIVLLISNLSLSVISCKKKKKEEVTPAEIVTSLNLTLDAPKGKQDVIALFNDMAGVNNKTAPTTLTLDANTLYTGTITLEDESVTPKKDVSDDYTITYRATGTDLTITNGKTPQVTTRSTTSATNASLEIILTKNGNTSTVKFPLVVRP